MAALAAASNARRPVRVLHLISELCDGGSTRWLRDIVRLSDAQDFAHRVVTIYPDYEGDTVYADPFRARGVYEPSARNPLLKLSRRIIKTIREHRNRIPARKLFSLPLRVGADGLATWRVSKALMKFRPDVIHAHTLPEFIPGVIIRMLFGKPLVHTVPCLFSQMKDSDYDWMPRLYSLLHPWVDCFYTGERAGEELLSVGVPESKIIYDVCGVDLQRAKVARAERERHYGEVRRSLRLPRRSHITLSVGRLHRTKGHLFTIEALPKLLGQFPELHALILGEGEERNTLETRARELGVGERVHLIGFQPDPLPYYAAADVYLRTTTLEPENLSFFQAMAMGLPVVGFDTGRESDPIAKIGNGILLAQKDPKALAEAIEQTLALPDQGRAMGEKGATFAHEHLDVRQAVSLLCSTYADLSRKRRARGRQNNAVPRAHFDW
jgi:glycosyltransferase involved in cell wall biosynthesis